MLKFSPSVIDVVSRNVFLNLDVLMIALRSSFVMKGALLVRTCYLLIGTCLLNMQKTVSLKHFIFFLRHNFQCLIKTFHYQSVYNHGKPQCDVSIFEILFSIPLQSPYESRKSLFQRHCFLGSS